MKLEPLHLQVLSAVPELFQGPKSIAQLKDQVECSATDLNACLDQLEMGDLVMRSTRHPAAAPIYFLTEKGALTVASAAEAEKFRQEARARIEAPAPPPAVAAAAPLSPAPSSEPTSPSEDAAAAPTPPQESPMASTHKHGETREQIHQIIAQASPQSISTATIAEAVGLGARGTQFHLVKLEEEGRIARSGAGRSLAWSLDGGGGSSPAATFVRHKRAQKATRGRPKKVSVSRNCLPKEALEALALRLQPIENADRKQHVLQYLVAILDPTISAVLEEISADLARAA